MKSHHRFLILLVLLTLLVRGGVLIAEYSRLSEDSDAYLGIAEQIASGHGFSSPGSDHPTAFRPPLYPILLAVALFVPGNWGIVILHLILGAGTVLLTWRLGTRLHSETGGKWAAVLIAFDPLLIQYSTLPMTETLCGFLAVWALNLMVPMPDSKWKSLWLGVVLGLCVLSRPTFLVFAGLAVLVWMFQVRKSERPASSVWLLLLGIVMTVSPWGIRNALVFGEFRLTTTHGGYTLLLGNNPVFYREVVLAPWGTTWDGESLARWQASLEEDMKKADPKVKTEPERDHWMAQRGRKHIAENPGLFLRATWLRFLRFWNVFPPDSALNAVRMLWEKLCQKLGLPWEQASETISRLAAWSVALFYAGILGSFLIGMLRLNREQWSRWWPLVLMIGCFCLVHLIYWSNTRMRAPVMPAVVLLAVRGWAGFGSRERKNGPQRGEEKVQRIAKE